MDTVAKLRAYVTACNLTGNLSSTHSQDCAEAAAEIERLWRRLAMIADIAEGSGTVNSLPHIAKIARGLDEQKATTEK